MKRGIDSSDFNAFITLKNQIKAYADGKITLETLLAQITLESIKNTPTDGPDKDRSVIFMLLTVAQNLKKSDAFFTVFKKYKEQITKDDFMPKISFVLLVKLALLMQTENQLQKEHLELFLIAIEYIDLDDLKLKSKEGKPLFWLLAQIAYHGEETLFKKMWDIHKDRLTIDHFRMTCESSGESALWLLAATNQIENIWERFENQITIKDLRNTPIGPLSDISLLNRIKTQPTVFSMTWKKFAKQITANDLLLGAAPMSDNSVLCYLLANSNCNNYEATLQSFKQIPNLSISPDSHAYNLILQNLFLSDFLKSLVYAKYYFYKSLSSVKSKFKPSHSMNSAELERLNHDADFKNLRTTETDNVLKEGYVNTFYDIGKMLEELGAHELAFEAYAKVPDSSFYKNEVYEKLALYWHGKALNSPLSKAFQKACLEKALSWALKCPQDIRQHCIKRIALTCILDNYSPDYQQPVSENLLALIGEHTTPQWCLEQFEQIKQTLLLKKKCHQQKEEIKELESALKEQSQKLATLKKSPNIALDDNDLTLNIKNILTQTKKILSKNTISSTQSDFSSTAVLTSFRATPGASTPLDKPLSKEEETLTQFTFSPSRAN
ncbi:MAG: hypothetical protein JSS07_05845 [Proteobacteria bacterium]|nr:hypothetical protein [Pseudomonadota bacterium]